MKIPELLDYLDLDGIVGLDYETYWSSTYRMGKNYLSTSEYVLDERFKSHMCSVQWHNERKAKVIAGKDMRKWARDVDWKRTGVLAHHTHFDGLILSHHDKVKPAFMLDTLSMARALMPLQVGGSLDKVSKALGLGGKKGGDILVDTQGKRDLTAAEYKKMAKYAGHDIELTWEVFKKMMQFFPPEELHVIDITVRMFTDPTLIVNPEKMQAVVDAEIARKDALLKKVTRKSALLPDVRITKTMLSSNDQFSDLLVKLGVEVPMKVSPTVAKRLQEGEEPVWPDDYIPALAAGDYAFKSLASHEDRKVRDLIAARMAVKSVNLERKAEKFAGRGASGRPVPVYLNYAGAKTWRWSGSDGVNWQNMNRGSGMREAIEAPKGHMLLIADQAQIEDRLNCWYCGQNDVIEAYRRGDDVYAHQATAIYGFEVNKDDNPKERFVGKTLRLGGGYQAGGKRIGDMLRTGQFGPAIEITDAQAEDIKNGYRQSNHMIVAGWRETQNLVKSAFLGQQLIEHKYGVEYEGKMTPYGLTGFIHHRPTGVSIRYDDIQVNDRGDISYMSAYRSNMYKGPTTERTKLYGGILTENRTQWLARMILAEQMRLTKLTAPKSWRLRHAMTTHDEVVLVIPIRYADRALEFVKKIMLTPPEWCEGLPFGVDAHLSERYDK